MNSEIKFNKKLLRLMVREHKRCIKYPYLYPSFRRAKRLAWILLKMDMYSYTDPEGEKVDVMDDSRLCVMFICGDDNYCFYKQKISYNEYDIKFDESCHPLIFNRLMAKTLFHYIENFNLSISSTE